MGITERREREKEQRRNVLTDAAERVFFSIGWAIATMDDVAEEAELSKGTLYLYFKRKEDLYKAINLRGLKILKSMFEKAVAKCKIGIEKTRAIGQTYHQFYLDYPDYFSSMQYWDSREMDIDEENSIAAECDKHGHKVIEIVAKAVQTGIEDGTIRPDLDPLKTAVILWAQSSGVIQLISLKGDHLQSKHGLNSEELVNYAFKLTGDLLRK